MSSLNESFVDQATGYADITFFVDLNWRIVGEEEGDDASVSTDTPGVAIWIDPATPDDVASQAWKEVSDQVFIIPGFEHGVGWLVCCVL